MAPNKWTTTLDINDAQAAGMSINVSWELTVISETSMAIKSHLSMQFPKEMVAMMGGSANCNVDSNGILERLEN